MYKIYVNLSNIELLWNQSSLPIFLVISLALYVFINFLYSPKIEMINCMHMKVFYINLTIAADQKNIKHFH